LPQPSEPGYLEALHGIVSDERVTYVHPQPDAELAFLSEHRDELPGLLLIPDHADLVAARNRLHTNRLLTAADVPVPTVVRLHQNIDTAQALAEVAERSGRACVRAIQSRTGIGSLPVGTGEQISAWLTYWGAQSGASATEFMLSTFLPGRVFSFQSLWFEGRLVTSAAAERMESLFSSNGLSTLPASGPSVARTVHRDDVNAIAASAVRALSPRPHGPFSVLLREDSQGIPCVTDVLAGRYPATIDFLAAAGMNLPRLQMTLAYGTVTPALPRFDAVEDELYWVRGVDRKPHLFKGAPWVHQRAA
jgi:carbamoyl-phosphate synthase large subunit